MFGGWGEPDHDTSITTIHAALDAGINFIDTADVYSQGESEIIVGKALAGGRRDDVVLATKVHMQMGVPVEAPPGTKGDPNKRGNSRRWIVRRGREQPAPAEHRLDRPVPDSPPRSRHRHRGDPGRADRSAAPGQDPRLRLLDVPRPPDGQRAVGQRKARTSAGSSPSSRRIRCWSAVSRPTSCPWRRSTGWACCRGARWPAAGSPGVTARTRSCPNPGAAADFRPVTTCPLPTTSASSTQPTHSGNWPMTPGCR